jgi:hypothetical protein
MTTIVVFVSSLFVALAFLGLKAVEIKYGKKNILLDLLSRFDLRTDKLISDLKFRSLQLIQSARYIVLVQTKAVCKKLLETVEEKIMDEYRARYTMIMGQKEIAGNGSASFYLKKISEDKSSGRKGKIEESL